MADADETLSELLLMELLCLLPDASKRQALHKEYATQKVMRNIRAIKDTKKTSSSGSSSSSRGDSGHGGGSGSSGGSSRPSSREISVADLSRPVRALERSVREPAPAPAAAAPSQSAAWSGPSQAPALGRQPSVEERDIQRAAVPASQAKSGWVADPTPSQARHERNSRPLDLAAQQQQHGGKGKSKQKQMPPPADPARLDEFMGVINTLLLPTPVTNDLTFLTVLLLHTTMALGDRFGGVRSVEAKKHALSFEKKKNVNSAAQQIRLSDLLSLSGLPRLGIMPATSKKLANVVNLFKRQAGDNVVSHWLNQGLSEAKDLELFLFYEYLHAVLGFVLDSDALKKEEERERLRRQDAQQFQQMKKEEPNDDLFGQGVGRKSGGGKGKGKGKNKKSKGTPLLF